MTDRSSWNPCCRLASITRVMLNLAWLICRSKGLKQAILDSSSRIGNHDTFTFKFIRLCPDHLQRINSIFFEEALETAGVIFRSRKGFKHALEAYFALDLIRFKQVSSNTDLSKRSSAGLAFGREKNDWIRANRGNYLKLLEDTTSHLESSVKARYFDRNTKFFRWMESMPASFLRKYHVLGWSFTRETVDADWQQAGGNIVTLVNDLLQANAITNLITLTDVLLREKEPAFKTLIRKYRTDLLVRLASKRLWLHLRRLRERVKSQSTKQP